ncbi:hypothetical protein PGB90_010029 [Kerria lacca]
MDTNLDQTLSGYYIFGRDIMTIPCLRKCVLTGIGASISSTLLYFLFTSHGAKAAKCGYLTFIGVTFPYWYFCQNKFYAERFELEKIKNEIQKHYGDEYLTLDSLEDKKVEFAPETFG